MKIDYNTRLSYITHLFGQIIFRICFLKYKIYFQNYTKTWDTENPFFTPCFELTVLIWAPCVFLWLFTPLDAYYIKTSRYANIPWGTLNISRYIITFLLLAITLADLIMGIIRQEEGAYNVHIVTPAVKLISFVSFYHTYKLT